MSKFYAWNITNLFAVLSSIAVNKDFDLSAQNSQSQADFLKLQVNDYILSIKNNYEIFGILKVLKTDGEKIKFNKEFETASILDTTSYDITVPEDRIIEINEDLFNKIVDNLKGNKNQKKNINKKIDKPHNRIIFGAPGTGKSHQLKTELADFPALTDVFQRNKNLEKLITEEIKNKSAAENNGDWAASVAIKYSFYFKELETWFNSQGPGGAYNDFLNRTFGLSAKQPELMVAAYRGMNLNRKTIFTETYERVTFHPNYSYAQFVGTYKPVTKKYSDKTEIEYEFVPGPFLRTFIKAYKTKVNCLLLIEEINRANVAAVFGDVFQLLDRDENGESEYPITTSEDLRNFLAKPENLGGIPDDYTTISLPSNMYIWATMNSSDQGVLPMDAAFKRRWNFEYIGINDGENDSDGKPDNTFLSYTLPISHKEEKDGKDVIEYLSINWNKIRHAINDKLKEISGVNEDKLLGPYFLSKTLLEKATSISAGTDNLEKAKICSAFKSKVLMYLYEDVVKMNPTDLFNKGVFAEDKPLHYSDLCEKFDEVGLEIFDKDFIKE